MGERRFTLEEANAMLGDLRDRLPRIREARRSLLASAEVVSERAPGNGGGGASRDYWDALRSLRKEVEAVIELGVILRDPETALVDFPSIRDGEPVFLCWRLGEDEIGFWHDTESGFAGRRPL